jgi:hypothetical protein
MDFKYYDKDENGYWFRANRNVLLIDLDDINMDKEDFIEKYTGLTKEGIEDQDIECVYNQLH